MNGDKGNPDDGYREEAEQLAYAASHDLRQPLRTILHCLQMLQRRHGEELGPAAGELVSRALEATEHGHAMIDALLVYSRLSTRAGPHEPVDLNQAAARAQRSVEKLAVEAGATFEVEELPTVVGERHHLVLLLEHLLRNGVIFHGPEPPSIRVRARRDGAWWRIEVSDNGIGIAEGDQERIFEMFRSLHPPGRYPGLGMGLAICRKIAELHGGRIEVESSPGRGATFSVAIPARDVATAAPPAVRIARRSDDLGDVRC